jgi:hypothetical protein
MRITRYLVIAALAALSVLALYAGPASASRAISIAPIRGLITLTNVGSWTFSGKSGLEAICTRAILLISLATQQILKSSAGKLPEGLIGWITEGAFEGCTERIFGTTLRVFLKARKALRESWFPLLYQTFLGTLPAITGLLIIILRMGFELRNPLLGACLYNAPTVGNLIRFNANRESERNTFLEEARNLATLTAGGGGCPPEGVLRGAGTITPVLRITLL